MSDSTQIATADDHDRERDRRRSRRLADALRLRTRFLSLADLDGRASSTRRVRDLIRQYETDIPDPSTAQKQIITRCALTSVMIEDIEARYLKGHAIDPLIHATLSNGLRRLLTTLGLERRAKPVMSLHEHLAMLERNAPPSVDDDQDDESQADSQVSAQGGQEHQDDVSQLRLEDKRSEDEAA